MFGAFRKGIWTHDHEFRLFRNIEVLDPFE
jgi:hypothetical protein